MRKEIIQKADSYIGMMEIPANSNNVVFNTDYYGHAVSGTCYSWCCAFCWDIFRMCGAGSYFYGGKKIASCTALLNYYKSNHPSWVVTDVEKVEAGDLVLYQFDSDSYADHIGIFEKKYSSTKFYAIEGNTSASSAGSQDNGGCVARKLRKTSLVMAFIHIPFDGEKKTNPYVEPTSTVKYNVLTKNIALESVKWVQWELVEAGADIKIDGKIGKSGETYQALVKYQKEHGLTVDGKCGPATRTCMKND